MLFNSAKRSERRHAAPPTPLAAGGTRPQRKPVNFASFLTKQVFIFALVAFLIVMIDFTLALCLSLFETAAEDEAYQPNSVTSAVGDALHQEDGAWSIDDEAQNLLAQLPAGSWAMLVDDQGAVAWSWNLPSELDRPYGHDDLMAIAHYNALGAWPTWLWIRDDGNTLIVGEPEDTYIFFRLQFPTDRLLDYPLGIMAILLVDMLILFCMYAVVRRRAQRAVKPVTDALDKLSRGQTAEVVLGGDLAEIGDRLTDVSRIIERKDSARALWIRGVSHDIRTPLSMVVGQADALSQREDVPDDAREQASAIREQGMRIAALVTDLNTAAQLDYDEKPVQTDRIALARIVRDACVHHLNEGFDDTYPLICDIDEDVADCEVVGDERLLSRAIENLLANARAHNPQGCTIRVTLSSAETGCVAVCVSDNGRGTTPEQLDAIRSRIMRAQQTGTVAAAYGEEHGLGLVLVDRIARAHNGSFSFEGSAAGFAAKVTLPLA